MSGVDTSITPAERDIVKAALGPIMAALAGQNDGVVTSGAISRVLAFALAAVIETDDNLHTPKDFRQAGDYVGKLVAHHIKELRAEGDETGASFMADIVNAGRH